MFFWLSVARVFSSSKHWFSKISSTFDEIFEIDEIFELEQKLPKTEETAASPRRKNCSPCPEKGPPSSPGGRKLNQP